MDVVSLCPLPAAGFTWQANTGAYALTVIVKATFLLKPGEAELSSVQELIAMYDRFWDDNPRRSVRIPSDCAPYKPRADVMLVGRAFAPQKRPVRHLVARLLVNGLDKSIEVWCDRRCRSRDRQVLEGPPFTEMPLLWERAAGGSGTMNPVGMPVSALDRDGMVTIPNLQPLELHSSPGFPQFAPAGFGPIGSNWPTRVRRLGRYAREFRDPGWEQSALPSDFDSGYFLAAPPDQLVSEIRPNERLVLDNLHPEHERLITTLPGTRPRAVADRASGQREEVRLVADTLWIDTDRGLCCVVWRGRIGLRNAAEAGRIAVWVDGMPMVAPLERRRAHDREAAQQGYEDIGATTDLSPFSASLGPALPFVPGSGGPPEPLRGALVESEPWAAIATDDGTGTIGMPAVKAAKSPLPFGADEPGAEDIWETIPLPPIEIPSAPALVKPPDVVDERPCEPKPSVDLERSREAPLEMASEEIRDLSIEDTATIAAELAERAADRAEVLKAHALNKQAWVENEARWAASMHEEQGRGKNALREAYDAAYVKRVEGFRGPIGLAEYARLVIGLERGRVNQTLDELNIQRPALMRIVRLWTKKVAKDARLAEEAKKLLSRLRSS